MSTTVAPLRLGTRASQLATTQSGHVARTIREVLGREDGAPPPVDLNLEKKTGDFLKIPTSRSARASDLNGSSSRASMRRGSAAQSIATPWSFK